MANSAERWGAKSAVYEYEHLDFPPLYVLSEKLYARNLDTVDARVFSYSAQEIYPDMVRAVVIMPKGQFKFKEVIVPKHFRTEGREDITVREIVYGPGIIDHSWLVADALLR